MFLTHFYDLLAKFASLAIVVCILIASGGSLPWGMTAVAFGVAFGSWWFLFRPFSSMVYARMSLGTRLSFYQAKRASALFSPVLNLTKWNPMRHVASLPESERTGSIVSASDELLAYYDARAAQWREAPPLARLLRVVLWLLVGGSVIGALSNIPPFSWISDMQAHLLGGKYYLIITVVVSALPFGLALGMLEIRHGIRSIDPDAQRLIDATNKAQQSPSESTSGQVTGGNGEPRR